VKSIYNRVVKLAAIAFCVFLIPIAANSQSSDQNFPTAVTTNEIDGTIKARDIGDSRLTSYYYAFDGGQGDVFINAVTTNFFGDIDVFAQEGLRPLTKMVIYPDSGANETGRVIYLRKPERLILRIEGRSPNDDPATFRIKFAGSFVALAPQKQPEAPAIKQSEASAESGVKVNSVGTIVEVLPTPTVEAKPAAKESVAEVKKPPVAKENPKKSETKAEPAGGKRAVPAKPSAKTTPTTATAKKEGAEPARRTARTGTGQVATILGKTAKPKKPVPAAESKKGTEPSPAEIKPDPLASIRLVVQLKDGEIIERPMSEVKTFSVVNGQLTVVAKDGTSVKYSILDVAKVTIE
jgi:hypothetical protein